MNHQPPSPPPLHFLAISGSLRATSSTTTLLRALMQLAPPHVTITLYEELAALPHFNPDLDGPEPPTAVQDWRGQLQAADAVIICSPEYAHGVPGSLKNALDWVVGSGEFMHKPVALLNASLSSTHAQAALTETLTVMMAKLSPQTSIRVPLKTNKIDVETIIANAEITQALQRVLTALAQTAWQNE